MPRPKQHHYVTKAYLDGFLSSPDGKQLVCYGRRGERFLKSPDELGKQRNYYAVKNVDGTWDDSLEELIERTVERPGLPIVKALAGKKTRLSWKDRNALTMLIAFQERRTPAARAQARGMSAMMQNRILQEIRLGNPEQTSFGLRNAEGTAESEVTIAEMLETHASLCDDHARAIHKLLVKQVFDHQNVYVNMKFTVLYAPCEARFITSDSPVVRIFHRGKGDGAGLTRPDVEVRFPLSSTALFVLTHDFARVTALQRARGAQKERIAGRLQEVNIRYLSAAEVLSINKAHARHAHHWVYSPLGMDWLPPVFSQPCLAPEMVDMSGGNLMHFRLTARYDPRMDA